MLDRRRFIQGLAGTAAVLAGISKVGAEEAQTDRTKAGRKSVGSDFRNYRGLIGALEGFSATLIREHLALLERYRQKLSEIEKQDRMIDLALSDPIASKWRDHVLARTELHNAVRLHELYFDALTSKSTDPGQRINKALEESFGSFDQWWVKFRATAIAIRAWSVLAFDNRSGRLMNYGLDRDSEWPFGIEPLLVVDMAEHAYVLDFIGQPFAYLDAWRARIDWAVVDTRLSEALRK